MRPTSITVIARLLMIMGLLTLGMAFLTLGTVFTGAASLQAGRLPSGLALAILFAGPAVVIWCGKRLLDGDRTARSVLLGWNAFGLALGLLGGTIRPADLAVGLPMTLVIIYILYRPAASAFFARPTVRRVDRTASVPSCAHCGSNIPRECTQVFADGESFCSYACRGRRSLAGASHRSLKVRKRNP